MRGVAGARAAVDVFRVEPREEVVEVRIRLDVLVAAARLQLASCDAFTAAAFDLSHASNTCAVRPEPY